MYTASLFIDLPELELRGVEDARPTPRLHWRIRSRLERWNARSFLRATLASPIFGSSASHSLILRNSPHRRPIDRFCFFLPSFLSLFSPPPLSLRLFPPLPISLLRIRPEIYYLLIFIHRRFSLPRFSRISSLQLHFGSFDYFRSFRV